ncbi:glycosyltransferase [Micromonospora auratinigra]|uniref:Glycosyltransferase, MGT family n=1 Tax=Micromonospora auratinigra TaxID=261654 RepID=A0A1A8Z4I7_9ACTN|nr:glycosyltransferase [Micromonospora auratinigra]SBT38717.1 glycosyltransferase, MGT family [Micromonospora auratinigra]
MARFLLASVPIAGHTNPLKPIARALVDAGHVVDWYTGRDFRDGVVATGATHLPMHAELERQAAKFSHDHPEREALTGLAGIRWDLKHLFLDPVVQQVADLRELTGRLRPDAVIADMGFVGASALHELTGIAWISVGISPLPIPSRDTAPFGSALSPSATTLGRLRNRLLYSLMDNVVLRDVGNHWQQLRASIALPPTDVPPFATISPLLHLQNGVAEFEYPRSDLPPQVRFVGSLADDPSAPFAAPAWWGEVTSRARPVVHVTQGTVANENLDDLVGRTMRVLSEDEVFVVVTTGGPDPSVLGELPGNARAARFVPHSELLPFTDVMVTNGGYGGVQKALSLGVPLVVAGATEDKPEVAARVAYAGAGLRLRSAAPGDDTLRTAIRRVLREPSFRRGAQRLRDAYARIDTRAELVRLIEGSVRQTR